MNKSELIELAEKAKTKEDWRKIKKIAMANQINLGNLRKKFCQKCYSPSLRIKSIKKRLMTLKCENCQKLSRWKLRT